MNSMKRQKDMTLTDEHPAPPPPSLVDVQHATGEEGRIAPEGMKKLSQSKNNTQL